MPLDGAYDAVYPYMSAKVANTLSTALIFWGFTKCNTNLQRERQVCHVLSCIEKNSISTQMPR